MRAYMHAYKFPNKKSYHPPKSWLKIPITKYARNGMLVKIVLPKNNFYKLGILSNLQFWREMLYLQKDNVFGDWRLDIIKVKSDPTFFSGDSQLVIETEKKKR